MKVCGIVLKASDATLCVIDEQLNHVEVERKITLGDDESREAIVEFMESVARFIQANDVEAIGVKKRSKTGRYAGGGLTFKMEALIQLASNVPLVFITPQALSAFDKKTPVSCPESLTKDQQPAFQTAVYTRKQLSDDA